VNDFDTIEQAIGREEERLRLLEGDLRKQRETLEQQKQALELLKPLRNGTFQHAQHVDSPPGPVAAPSTSSEAKPPLAIGSAILAALECFPPDKDFTSRQVYEELLKIPVSFDLEKSRSNISTYLRHFAVKGVITIIEGGTGQKATFYRKK
jgi:hypothetical protein